MPKNNRKNYPRKCFRIKEKEAGIKIYPRVSCNRPSINWCIPNRTSPLFKECCLTFVKKTTKKQKTKTKKKQKQKQKDRSFPSNLCGLPGVRKGISKYVPPPPPPPWSDQGGKGEGGGGGGFVSKN